MSILFFCNFSIFFTTRLQLIILQPTPYRWNSLLHMILLQGRLSLICSACLSLLGSILQMMSYNDYHLEYCFYVAVTSWKSESSNIGLVVLDKLLFGFPSP